MPVFQPVLDFVRRSRLMFLTCTLVPVSVGGAAAFAHNHQVQIGLFVLTLLGVSAAHLGVNLSNDYFDFKQGADGIDTEGRPYSGGGGAITKENVSPEDVRTWFMTCFGVAAGIGLALAFVLDAGRLWILLIAILGFVGGYYYTAPPLRFAYRGLGELDIFVFLGPAPVLGTFAVLAGTMTGGALAVSMPVAGLIAALLWINEYTDYETDKAAGKRNLVVRLGKKNARWGFAALVGFVFVSIAYAVIGGHTNWPFFIAYLAAPLGVRSVIRAIKYWDDTELIKTAQGDALLFHLFGGLLCALGIFLGSL